MKPRLVDLIVCPRCRGPLELSARAKVDDEVLEGHLTCQTCGQYPIVRGIPRLLASNAEVSGEAQRTVDRFGAQWNDFDSIRDHYEQQFLGWIHPSRPETFRGKVVLEGGCGKGRHSALVAKYGAREVIAVDLGSAVEAARRNTRHHPNVHIVQADLHQLPVADGTVDVAFSVGVLHHTPNPARCFELLSKTVRAGGRVIVWVYGRENNGWIIHFVNPLRERLASRFPHRWLYHASKLPAALVCGVARGVYRPIPASSTVGSKMFYGQYMRQIAEFPFAEIHAIVHDHLTPPIAHYIGRADFESWFTRAGLEHVEIGWHNENSWRGTGVRPSKDT